MAVETKNRRAFLPYGHQHIDQDDIEAVTNVLQSGWLTQGPTIEAFETDLAREVGAAEVIACCNGSAALHLSMLALGIKEKDTVVTSPITFMASANCARYVGASVRFVEVDPESALICPDALEETLQKDVDHRIKAVVPVHFAGQPVDLPRIYELAKEHGAFVVDDACHALGGSFSHQEQRHLIGCGQFTDLTVFSFHPVKHVTTGEGGVVATNNHELAERLRQLRNHNIQRDHFANQAMACDARGKPNPWYHELQELGYNYRMNDIQAALGVSQLKKLKRSVERRNEIARLYDKIISETFDRTLMRPLVQSPHVTNAYHLYVVQISYQDFGIDRASVMNRLRQEGIGTQVHYIPVHLQPYYRKHSGTAEADFPGAEDYYSRALSIPMYPDLTDDDCFRVIDTIKSILTGE